jgi:hypothetical protein
MNEQEKHDLLVSIQHHRDQIASDKKTRAQFEAVSEIKTANAGDTALRSTGLVTKFDQSIVDHTLAIQQITAQLREAGIEINQAD